MICTCRTFIEFLADYLSGGLPEAERVAFDAHLAECPWCVAYLATYRETILLSRVYIEEIDAPAEAPMPEELVRAILAARNQAGEPGA